MQFLSQKFDNFLQDLDAQIINPIKGDNFNPRLHKPLERSETQDASLNGKISKVFMPGVLRGDRIIQLALVSVYVSQTENQI
jgi:molecular chaperone GrpE (heat shock protein)